MPGFPLRPNLKQYRGSNEKLLRKNREYHAAMAHRVAAHVNKLVANNPDEVQQYVRVGWSSWHKLGSLPVPT